MRLQILLGMVGMVVTVAVATAPKIDESAFCADDIIQKDVVIIGGGSSGTYGAVRLREDCNVTVLVIEKDDHLVRRLLLSRALVGQILTVSKGDMVRH